MSANNSSHFTGRVAAIDPLGTAGLKVRLAVDGWDSQAKAKKTTFVTLICWGKQAETIGKYAPVGKQIAVEAEYGTRDYEVQGQKRVDHQFTVRDIMLLADGKQPSGQFSGPATAGFDQQNVPSQGPSNPWD